MDLSNLTLAELRDLERDIKAQMVKREKVERDAAIEQIRSIAQSIGLPLNQLIAGNKLKGTKVAPVYRDPEDSNRTWTGRGRRPAWVEQALSKGRTLDSLRAN